MRLKLNKRQVCEDLVNLAYKRGVMPKIYACSYDADDYIKPCYAGDGISFRDLSGPSRPCWLLCPHNIPFTKMVKLAREHKHNKRFLKLIDELNSNENAEEYLHSLAWDK